MRAKIPISIFGLPFLFGISAGESQEFRLNLATAFDSGPSFQVLYRPNDSWNPFNLNVKIGIGAFSSPFGAPMAMTTEFSLLGRNVDAGGPRFSILFKLHHGDFSIKKTTGSAAIAPAIGRKIIVDVNTDEEGSMDGAEMPVLGFWPENRIDLGKKVNGFPTDFIAGGGDNEIQDLLSSVELSTRSVLPLCSRIGQGWL